MKKIKGARIFVDAFLKKRASNKSQALVETIKEKLNGLNKPRRKLHKSIILLFLSMRGRYNLLGMSRYGEYSEKAYRFQFEQRFDFMSFNLTLTKENLSDHLVIAFDPSYLPKSGKRTPNIDKFWSGCPGKAVKCIEIGGMGVVDSDANQAFH